MNAPASPDAFATAVNFVVASRADAELHFRCNTYRCDLAGHACAGRWTRANPTGKPAHGNPGGRPNDAGCVACPAGKARAKLLRIDGAYLAEREPGR